MDENQRMLYNEVEEIVQDYCLFPPHNLLYRFKDTIEKYNITPIPRDIFKEYETLKAKDFKEWWEGLNEDEKRNFELRLGEYNSPQLNTTKQLLKG